MQRCCGAKQISKGEMANFKYLIIFIFQSELRKSRLSHREDGECNKSLHSSDIEIPSEMPKLSEEFFQAIVNDAMVEHYPNQSSGNSKPWFSNPRTTIQKIEADVLGVSHLLACIFIHDDTWTKIVECHNEALHGGEQPLMDTKIMEAYFHDIPLMRSKAFELVRPKKYSLLANILL